MINYLEKYLKYKSKYQQLKNQIGGKIVEINTTYKDKQINVRVPENFICPISFEIMLDPVVTADGYTFERSAISRWLEGHNTSPLTGLELENKTLTSIFAFKNSIEEVIEEEYNKQLDQQIGELDRLSTSGDPVAQYKLALIYISGEGLVVKNIKKAIELLKSSAIHNHNAKLFLNSPNFIDSIFNEGKRLHDEDYFNDAVIIWNEAVLLKHPDSHAYLADMLFGGRLGVHIDVERAVKLAYAGMALGSVHCKGVIGSFPFLEMSDRIFFYEKRIIGSSYYDYDYWFRLANEAAIANSCFGQFAIGMAELKGWFTSRIFLSSIQIKSNINYREVVRLFRLAAAQGHIRAQGELGSILCAGMLGPAQDMVEGIRLLRLTAKKGYIPAMLRLANILKNDYNGVQDIEEAVRLYRIAAVNGDLNSQIQLGIMYEEGEYIAQDYAEAVRFFRLAAELKNNYAQFLLGRMFELGLGVAPNYDEAIRLYRLSAVGWYQPARLRLEELGINFE